jgi:quercetin dioxygenase-like cupin family protein
VQKAKGKRDSAVARRFWSAKPEPGHGRRSLQVLAILLSAPFAAGHVHAQSPSEILHDNAHVRVVRTTIGAHQSIPQTKNQPARVLVYLDRGEIKTTAPDGKFGKFDLKAGDVRWATAGVSPACENAGDQPLQVIEIELKGKKQPAAEVSDLDPLRVDPKHYQLALENDQVRVIRVRFGPLENGTVHQHVRNYVVVYVTKQAKGDRGEVRLHLDEGTTTHTENNLMNELVERIAVELK